MTHSCLRESKYWNLLLMVIISLTVLSACIKQQTSSVIENSKENQNDSDQLLVDYDFLDNYNVTFFGTDGSGSVSITENIDDSIISNCTSYTLDRTDGLSNGDKVTLSLQYDATLLEQKGYRIVRDSFTYTVFGLKELTLVDYDFLDDFDVTFDGFDGSGSVSITENIDDDIIGNCTSYTLDRVDGLSNGDKVTLSLQYDAALLEQKGYRIVRDSFTYTVFGLKELEELNPFDYLDLHVSGFNGYGKLSYNSNLSDSSSNSLIEFSISPDSGLSNGDSVSVVAKCNEEILKQNGYIVTETEKSVSISGLTDVIVLDPYTDLIVNCFGISPFCTIDMNTSECDPAVQKFITYSTDKDYYTTGDDVIVQAHIDNTTAELYGYTIDEDECLKLKITSSLRYASTSDVKSEISVQLSEILRDYILSKTSNSEKMFGIGAAEFRANYNKNAQHSWNTAKFTKAVSIDQKALYMLTYKDKNQILNQPKNTAFNSLKIVLIVNANLKFTYLGIDYPVNGDIYVVVSIDNIVIEMDGTLSYEISSIASLESIDDIEKKGVTINSDKYNIDKITELKLIGNGEQDQTAKDGNIASDQLKGTVIGSMYGWKGNADVGAKAAFDGDINTFFDPPEKGEGYCGLDFGDEYYIISEVKVYSRKDWESRLDGAVIQGSNDGKNWTTLYQFSGNGNNQTGITAVITDSKAYSKVRYYNEKNHGDVAEIEVYGKKLKQ